jgi:iron complex outermembrane receptor protein
MSAFNTHGRINRGRRSALSIAIASCLTVTAYAQQTAAPTSVAGSDESLEEVIVTGFRASLAEALQNKRESNQIIESVSAEDIGKFPDQNVAESLQRLSGVQIDRDNGQGTKVRIRGLDQNVLLLNNDIFLTGLELYTRNEGNDRNANAASLEGIPAELLGGVDVIKSPTATDLEGGLGGIVNLKTRNPFDFTETTLAGNVRYADSGEGWEPLGALVFAYQFNERLAVIASASYDKQRFQTDALGGQNRGGWKLSDRPDRDDGVPDYFAPEYRYTTDRDEERERLGFSLAAAFRPTEATELRAEWFRSDLEILTEEASIKFPFASESPGLDTTQPFQIDGNGVLLSGTLVANSAEAISFVKNSDIVADNFQLAFKFDNQGAWRARAAAAYSQADQDSDSANSDVRYTQYTVRGADRISFAPNAAAPPNYRYLYNNNGGTLPSFSLVGTPDLYTNPNNGFFKSHWAFGDRTRSENWAVRGDVEFDPQFKPWGATVMFSGGARLAERKIDYEFGRYLADYSGKGELDGSAFGQNWTPFGYFQDGAIGYKSCEIPASAGANFQFAPCDRFGNSPALITPYQTLSGTAGRVEAINNFWSSGRVAGNAVLVQDRSQMSDAKSWIQALYPDTPFAFFPSPLETFQVEEQTTSSYLMADIGEPDDRYHINIGARVMRTELTIDQNAASNPDPTFWGTDSWNGVLKDFTTLNFDRKYTDVLPSMNVVLNVTDGTKVRFSAAKVVARQDLFQLGRGFETNFTRDDITNLFRFTNGSSGNPELEPYRAKQFDVSYEYYFGSQGLLAVTPFYKKVDSFITVVTQSICVMDQAGGRPGPVQIPINGKGGSIKGVEFGAQHAFSWGGGFNVNYTYSDSESPTFNDVDRNLPIDGVAEHSFNTQLYYQHRGFEARVSYTWRDESFDGNFGFADQVFDDDDNATSLTRTYGIWNRDYGQFDAQLGYQFSERLGVTLEAINITEEDASQYLQYENLPFTFASGSRRILVGFRGSF